MRNLIALTITLLFSCISVFSQEYYNDIILLKVKDQYRSSCTDNSISVAKQLFSENEITSVDRWFKNIPINHKENFKSDISLIYRLKYEGSDILKTISNLEKASFLEYAEVEYKNFLLDTTNDPLADSVTGNQPELKMHQVYQAWDITKGDSTILIAVSDAGTTTSHEDLVDNIYKNTNDPLDGIDNDNDGLIDNYLGWDFSNNDNDPNEIQASSNHGTKVCGIAGARTNNGVGISSIGYNCKIVPLKSASDANPQNVNKGYDAIQFAGQKGYDIINLSWGCGNCYSQTAQNIINNAALDNNVIIVSAAGNQEQEVAYYPASYENVISVTSLDINFEKRVNRSWHYNVDISTYGTDVYSTLPSGSYGVSNGTSFSSPMVASAAGLVKKVFPSYSAVQVMEQLRVTTDSIYHLPGNQSYLDKLGTGSMNVFNAVTNTSTPSIRNIRNYSNTYIPGNGTDTLQLYGDFFNHLNPSSNLKITMSSPSGYINMIDSVINVGTINSQETYSNTNNQFSFTLIPNTPYLTSIWMKFEYIADGYKDFQYKVITINPDYLNIEENEITTSVNSTGNFGFHSPNRNFGKGFLYNNNNFLYEGGLILSINENIISDNVRNYTNSVSEDFKNVETIHVVDPGNFSDYKATCVFTDTSSVAQESPIIHTVGTETRANYYAWNDSPDDKYIIAEYEIKNLNLDSIHDLRIGLFADWDIYNSNSNIAKWDFEGGFGYVKHTDDSLFAAIKPLWPYYGSYFAIDNNHLIPGNPIGIYDNFTDYEKYKTLSSLNEKIEAGKVPTDVSHVVGMNLGSLASNEVKTTAFAIIVGESLEDLRNSANSATVKYNTNFTFNNPIPFAFDTFTCFNSPATIRVEGGENYLLYGGENDFLVLDDSLPLTTQRITDTTIFYIAFPYGDFPSIKTPVTVYPYLPEINFWLEPDTLYIEDRNYMYPHNTSPYFEVLTWNLGNGIISTSLNPSANYSDTGTYYVSLYIVDSNNCSNYSTLPLVILPGNEPRDTTKSILEGDLEVIIAPNPVSDILVIKGLLDTKNSIEIINSTGQRIYNELKYGSECSINTSFLTSGFYILKINGKATFKLLKE